MTKEVQALVEEAFDLEEALDILRNIYLIDRWFTFPKFHESADYAVAMMNEAPQVHAEKLEYPADGKSRFFDWTMPLAWDAQEAYLEIIEPKVPDRYLARRMKDPCSLVMWSAPTPPEGVEAELVYWEGLDEEQRQSIDLKGKMVFTTQNPREMKPLWASKGAVGIVSSTMPNPEAVSEGIFWVNGWGDRPGGWALLADDSRLFGFGISPNRGKELIRLFEENLTIRVRAVVNSKLYEGTLPQVCGFIQGETDEEVLIIGHQFEVGADDNASGCAIIVELARGLGRLIEAGKLPRPRRSLRFITGAECYTTFAYASTYPERMARTIAGLNIDMISVRGGREPATFRILATPHANICFCDRLLARIVKDTFAQCNIPAEIQFRPYNWSDNILSDPLIDVPTPFLWNNDMSIWHTSYDTPEMVDPQMLRAVGIASGTYLLTLANAGPREALVLADEMAHLARRQIEEAPPERKSYLRDRQKDMMASISRLDPGNNLELARKLTVIQQELDSLAPPTPPVEAKGEAAIVPKAMCPAPLTFEKIPAQEWKDFPAPRWHTTMASLLQWANGKRTLAEIEQLTIGERGKCDLPVVPLFKFLQKHGYVEFVS